MRKLKYTGRIETPGQRAERYTKVWSLVKLGRPALDQLLSDTIDTMGEIDDTDGFLYSMVEDILDAIECDSFLDRTIKKYPKETAKVISEIDGKRGK